MIELLAQMAAVIGCGALWRRLRPLGTDPQQLRQSLAALVFVLLLPALVLLVLWRARLGVDSLRIALLAASGVLAAALATGLGFRLAGIPRPTAGALILAASFPNVTYLGLPVLEKVLGPWARSVAIQYDLFACTPLLLTLGVWVAQSHGTTRPAQTSTVGELLRVPALWAALVAALLNVLGAPLPEALADGLGILAAPVVPLMLLALGMSLEWVPLRGRALALIAPVLAVQLVLMPLLVLGLARLLGLGPPLLTPVVLEAAMPSMLLGVVFCDRYGLDTPLYALTVTLSTALSMITLPLWFHWLEGSSLS